MDLPQLRPTSRTELWRQLYEQLRAKILTGEIPPDEKLWTQEQLAEELNISRGTTIRAYQALQDDGLVVFVPGRGLFSATEDELAAIRKPRKPGRAGRSDRT